MSRRLGSRMGGLNPGNLKIPFPVLMPVLTFTFANILPLAIAVTYGVGRMKSYCENNKTICDKYYDADDEEDSLVAGQQHTAAISVISFGVCSLTFVAIYQLIFLKARQRCCLRGMRSDMGDASEYESIDASTSLFSRLCDQVVPMPLDSIRLISTGLLCMAGNVLFAWATADAAADMICPEYMNANNSGVDCTNHFPNATAADSQALAQEAHDMHVTMFTTGSVFGTVGTAFIASLTLLLIASAKLCVSKSASANSVNMPSIP